MTGEGSLQARFRASLATHGDEGPAVIAVSGGLDSCVLLHLARFGAVSQGRAWTVAHFDHGMRGSSAADARWVAGLCRAWRIPVHTARTSVPLRSEEEARDARYRFLEEVRVSAGASVVLTGHHADDQAETVLFRLLRGTGSRGLGGIPARRSPAIVRPLLEVWRTELLEYARRVRLSWREDPTNLDSGYARNALRNRILPDIERTVASGARRALVRLSDLAREEEAAWESLMPGLMRPLAVRRTEGGMSFDRAGLLDLHPAVRARVLRALAAELGTSLDLRTTRRAVDFAAGGSSGRAIDLAGALSFGVELERCVLGRAPQATEDRTLSIAGPGPGRGSVVLAGSPIPVAWGGDEPTRRRTSEDFDLRALRFPLIVRSRLPGDRIRLAGGTKKVKKVLLESRIPPSERRSVPLVVDAEGQVLWIPGLARAERSGCEHSLDGLTIGIG